MTRYRLTDAVTRYMDENNFVSRHYRRPAAVVRTIACDYRSGFPDVFGKTRRGAANDTYIDTSPRGRGGTGRRDDDGGAIVARARRGNRPRKSKAAADIAVGNSATPRQFARVGHPGIVACVPRPRHCVSCTYASVSQLFLCESPASFS